MRVWFMRHYLVGVILIVLILAVGCGPKKSVKVELANPEGENVGMVKLTEGSGGITIRLEAKNLPEGVHGFHLHEKGSCEGPDFSSAGGHFNPFSAGHGLQNEEGPHAGDLSNIYVGPDGTATVEVLAPLVTFADRKYSLLQEGGTAVVIHEGADDYVSDPSGDAGARIACGVIGK